MPPKCKNCGSLERHRIARKVLEPLKDLLFNGKALQFSRDMSIDESWLTQLEFSVFEEENSLDIQNIDRPDESYDYIFCIHILEHVKNDTLALRELERILSPHGFAFIMVPFPSLLPKTLDWGYPHPAHHHHYRLYGSDFAQKLVQTLKNKKALSIEEEDPATDAKDTCYFIAGSQKIADLLQERIKLLKPLS